MTSDPNITSTIIGEIDSALVRSLQDPSQPRHCERFYAASFDTIRHWDSRGSRKQWSGRHRALLDTVMKFICAPGANFCFRIKQIKQCRCDLSLPLEDRMHRASVDASTELWDLMTTMVSSATKLYVSTPPSLRLKLQSKSRPPWPSSTSDLVPYGLQASLDSMIDLVRHGIPSAFHILYAIGVAFGRSTVMKILVDHPDLPTALYYYLSIWEYFTAQIPLDDYSAVQTRITAAATGAVKTMEFIADLCGSPADALRRFMARAGAPRDQFVVLWSSLLTLWRRAQAIIPKDLLLQNRPAEVLLNSMLYSVICTYAGAGAVLHAVLKLPRDEIYYDPRILQLSEALPTWNPLYNRLEVTARQAADNPRCFGPGCVETEATAGRKFHVCGGCGHMKYCSKECQRRAWKDQRASHKPICMLIRHVEARGVRAPVWSSDNIMPVSFGGAAPELYPVLMTLADHIDKLNT